MPSSRVIKYVAAGLRTDTDKLLHEFVSEKTMVFLGFSKIWKRFHFSLVYMGRENEKELREFTEEANHIALSYLIPANSFPLKVGAIYVLYGLYIKQPFPPKTKIRIKLDQWKEVKSVLDVAIKEKHMDMFFIIHKLLEMSAFHFVSQTTMLGPRASVSGEPEVTWRCNRLQDLMNPLHTLVEEGYVEQLATMHEQYQKMKSCQDISHIKNLHMVHEDLSVDFAMKIKALFDRYRDYSSGDNPAADEDFTLDVGTRRALLKEKQYQSQVAVSRSRRHRSTIVELPVTEANRIFTGSPVKRGRGRPRKYDRETGKKSGRGRGRPRGRPRGSGKNQQMGREIIEDFPEIEDSIDVDGAVGVIDDAEFAKPRRRAPKPRKTRYHYAD